MATGQAVDPAIGLQVIAMRDAGISSTVIGQQTGLSSSTISRIVHSHGKWAELSSGPVGQALRQAQQQVLESGYRAAAALMLERSLDADKLDKASTYQLAIASKINLEASRLLAGESTSNISIQSRIDLTGLDQLCNALSQTLVLPDQTNKVE